MSSSTKKNIKLQSEDGKMFNISEAVAMKSQTLKHIIEDNTIDKVILVPQVTGDILAKILEYCQKHVDASTADSEDESKELHDEALKTWDAEFVKFDQDILYHLLMASNYLEIKSLLDLIVQTVANIIKGKTPEEIRSFFHIQYDFTPEEEQEVRKENTWTFE